MYCIWDLRLFEETPKVTNMVQVFPEQPSVYLDGKEIHFF
jgi:hypothetical protein